MTTLAFTPINIYLCPGHVFGHAKTKYRFSVEGQRKWAKSAVMHEKWTAERRLSPDTVHIYHPYVS